MKKYGLLILLLGLFIISLNSQNIRIAYFDSFRVMNECNDITEAQKLYQNARETWDREIDELSAEIRQIEQEYDQRKYTLHESGKLEYEERITTKKREMAQQIEKIFGEDGLAATKSAELQAPSMTKLRTIVERIAVDENYSIIFDAAAIGIFYAVERMDITQQIISEMNLSN